MVFLTNKYVGLHIVLPDGNPYKYVGYMGHPSKVKYLIDSLPFIQKAFFYEYLYF